MNVLAAILCSLVFANASASNDVIDYICHGQNGGT